MKMMRRMKFTALRRARQFTAILEPTPDEAKTSRTRQVQGQHDRPVAAALDGCPAHQRAPVHRQAEEGLGPAGDPLHLLVVLGG